MWDVGKYHLLPLGFIFHPYELCVVEGVEVNAVISKVLFSVGRDEEWKWLVILMWKENP